MGMTMTQKILARHAGLDFVQVGQLIEAKLDMVLGNDITTPVALTVIYTDPNFNLAPYDAWFLSHPLWTLSALPRIGQELNVENMENIKELIDSCLENSRYAQGRKDVREETWAYFSEGAVRAADYLVSKYEELTQEKKEGEAESVTV